MPYDLIFPRKKNALIHNVWVILSFIFDIFNIFYIMRHHYDLI